MGLTKLAGMVGLLVLGWGEDQLIIHTLQGAVRKEMAHIITTITILSEVY